MSSEPQGISRGVVIALVAGAALVVGMIGWCGGEPPRPETTAQRAPAPSRGAAVTGGDPVAERFNGLVPDETRTLSPEAQRRRQALQSAAAQLVAARRAQEAQQGLQLAQPGLPRPVTREDVRPAPAQPSDGVPLASLGKEQIRSAVKSVTPAIKACYEGGLKMKDDSKGAVKVSFTLVAADGGGFMRDAEVVDSELGNPVVDACILNALASAKFPMPEGNGEVRVTYPFKFSQAE